MKIILRPLEGKDLAWVLRYRNVPELNVNFNQPMPLSWDDQENWFRTQVITKKTFPYIISLGSHDIGYIAIQNINWVVRFGEISHFLLPWINRMTFVPAVHLLMLNTCFCELNLNRVWTICFEFNKDREFLLECGFKQEGILRQHCYKRNKYYDAFCMGIIRKDYENLLGGLQ